MSLLAGNRYKLCVGGIYCVLTVTGYMALELGTPLYVVLFVAPTLVLACTVALAYRCTSPRNTPAHLVLPEGHTLSQEDVELFARTLTPQGLEELAHSMYELLASH